MLGVQDLTKQLDVMQRTLVQIERRLQRVEAREPARITTHRPHVVRVQGICGGRPVIDGTRIPVKTVAGFRADLSSLVARRAITRGHYRVSATSPR